VDQKLIYSWYEQYKNGIFRYALSITKDSHLAEDVLQDTFLKVLSGARPRNPDAIQAWLYRIARNICFDRLRRRKKEEPRDQIASEEGDRYAYTDLISSLSDREKEIVTLKIIGGLTHREIGAVLGISAAAAQKRYERAIAALREEEDTNGTKT